MLSHVLICILVLTGCGLSSNAQVLHGKYFYGEDKFPKPIRISKSLESAIRSAPDFEHCLPLPVTFSDGRFEATKIDLNRDGAAEILVKGECGNSATSFSFWVFAKRKERYIPILFVATMGITIEKKAIKGFSNVSASGCNGSTCFFELLAFNGRRYAVKRTRARPNS